MAKEIDLALVVLTQAAYAGWYEVAKRVGAALGEMASLGRPVDPKLIPDEQGRVNDDGTLTIFVNVPGVIDVSMDVPASQWAYRAHPN